MTRPEQPGGTGTTARWIGGSRQRRICLAITGVVSTAMLAACDASSSPSKPPPASSSTASVPSSSASRPAAPDFSTAGASQPAAQPAVITVDKFAYAVPASVSPGAMVTVVNRDEDAHTVTADSGNAFDDQATAGTSTQFRAPTEPGNYPFHCTYHANMHGVLVVK